MKVHVMDSVNEKEDERAKNFKKECSICIGLL